jgi:hypothetical protein
VGFACIAATLFHLCDPLVGRGGRGRFGVPCGRRGRMVQIRGLDQPALGLTKISNTVLMRKAGAAENSCDVASLSLLRLCVLWRADDVGREFQARSSKACLPPDHRRAWLWTPPTTRAAMDKDELFQDANESWHACFGFFDMEHSLLEDPAGLTQFMQAQWGRQLAKGSTHPAEALQVTCLRISEDVST